MGLLDALRQYIGDALPGGSLNTEVPTPRSALSQLMQPVVQAGHYAAGIPDPNSQINRDLQGWHQRTQRGLADQLAGVDTPEAQQAYQAMMGLAGIAPVGMFIGKGAKTWDAVSMGRAQQMAKEGADPRAIWRETGTWQGPDGQWRQEIPDNTALFNKSASGENPITHGYGDIDAGAAFGNKNSLLEHPELTRAYNPSEVAPHTNIRDSMTMLNNERGAFDPSTGTMTLFAPATVSQAKSTALHEIQHAIQNREGWASGGNQSNFTDYRGALERAKQNGGFDPITGDADFVIEQQVKQFGNDPYGAYQRLAGEAEARATQSRMNMDAAQRRAKFPADSYDVPMDQLIMGQPNSLQKALNGVKTSLTP